jgi:hypothetical protein
MGISTVERNGFIERLQACLWSVGCLSLKAVSGPPKYTDEPQAIASAGCPSTRRPAHHRSAPSSLMPRLRSMRNKPSAPRPSMTTARGLSFGSRGAKGVMGWLGMRGKIQNNNHQWHATAQGVSHAAVKHPARFRGLRVLLALSCVHQPNSAFQRTPTHPIASATPCGRL